MVQSKLSNNHLNNIRIHAIYTKYVGKSNKVTVNPVQ